MVDRIFDPEDPDHAPSSQDFDGGWHTFGSLATLDEAGDLVGGSAWIPDPMPDNLVWLVYRVSDEAIVAQADLTALPAPVLDDWNDFTSSSFLTPGDVALDDTEQYIAAYATDGDFTYRDTAVDFPYGTGVVHATEGRFINGGTGAQFPDTGTSGFVFPADMLVDTGGGGPADVAGTSTGIASGTASVRKVGNAGGCGQAVGLATVIAGKRAAAAGAASAFAASLVTSVKVAVAAGTASATVGARASTVKVTPAGGRAAAVVGTAVQAKKVVAVSGRCTAIALGVRSAPQAPQIPGRLTAATGGTTLTASISGSALTASTTP